jgi:hypothetical protein
MHGLGFTMVGRGDVATGPELMTTTLHVTYCRAWGERLRAFADQLGDTQPAVPSAPPTRSHDIVTARFRTTTYTSS